MLNVFPTNNIEPSRNLTIARESLTAPSCQRHYSTQLYIVGREQAHFHSFAAGCVFARYLYTFHGIQYIRRTGGDRNGPGGAEAAREAVAGNVVDAEKRGRSPEATCHLFLNVFRPWLLLGLQPGPSSYQ